MRKRKMTITVLGLIGIFLIAALIMVPTTQAGEKTEKLKGRVVSQLTKVHVIKVGDVEGHIIGIYERRGLNFINGEVASYKTCGTFDSTKGKGTFKGNGIVTYKDGSTTVSKTQGTSERQEDGTTIGKGTFSYIRGSGRFAGIKGDGSYTFKHYTPFTKDKTKSDSVVDYTVTRTLPSK